MQYLTLILFVLVQGSLCENCTRTNNKKDFCATSCNPPQNNCSGDSLCVCDGDCGFSCVRQEINCPDPGGIKDGSMSHDGFDRGKHVKYSCHKGFTLIGNKILTCSKDGRWDKAKPRCMCRRTNEKAYAYCAKACDPNKKNTCRGNKECLCDGDCGYSCLSREILCTDPGSIEFGSKQPGLRDFDRDYLTVGDKVGYYCFPGYKMEGTSPLVCTDRGEWNNPKPTCVLTTCGRPRIPANAEVLGGKIIKNKVSFNYGAFLRFKCAGGYYLRGMNIPLSCGLTGWSTARFSCHLIDCGKLQTPEKAKKLVETGTGLNDRVIFECNEKGYEIRGSETRSCLENGTWSGVATSCEIISCGDPGVPMHGRQVNVSNNYKYGSFIEFDCSENYTFSGDRKIVCEETKDWGAPLPRCFAPCSDPGVPRNGTRGGNRFLSEDSVSFECHKGFELKGDETITCVDGVWKGTTPRCEVIKCEDPGTPQNGWKKKGSRYTYDGVVRFRCDTNYTLIGNKKIKCQENKEWTGSIPKCQGCGDGIPLGMGNGNILDDAITSSSKTQQNPAHLGRLGGNSYWCSDVESISHLEISLPKKQRITGAVVDVVNGQHIKGFALLAESGNIWDNLSLEAFKSSAKVNLTSEKEVDADKVQILIHRHREKESQVCLRAEMYGCDVD
ncbi:CUB and sushi domain-containing protein 1 [Acropora cervicornis]|uniref:CUB and sushi domain-containing protein 1 n=1 Tax=Acropora cervicornis TaxID=6130 RepID=A0AAD9QSR9_ACRCE|nr:CUB and sushi domain-containing protein 1 [Acropora cervicornis]